MSFSFQLSQMGIGRLDTPSLIAGRVEDLGRESVRNVGTST